MSEPLRDVGPASAPRPRSPGQWALLIVLVSALLLLGNYSFHIRDFLLHQFQPDAPYAQSGARGGANLTTRNVPAMLTYALMYVSLSIVTLHVILADRRRTRLVLIAYAATLALIGVLLVAGRVLGLADTLTPVARALIDGGDGGGGGLLSPLPVLLLLAIFRLAPRDSAAA